MLYRWMPEFLGLSAQFDDSAVSMVRMLKFFARITIIESLGSYWWCCCPHSFTFSTFAPVLVLIIAHSFSHFLSSFIIRLQILEATFQSSWFLVTLNVEACIQTTFPSALYRPLSSIVTLAEKTMSAHIQSPYKVKPPLTHSQN